MLRSALPVVLALALGPIVLGPSTARAADDPRFATDFLGSLRDRGYFDLAVQYVEALRVDPDVPADLKRMLDYEEGRTLIEETAKLNDPEVKAVKLEQAKAKIEAFVKANPDLPETTEALVELAHLLYERGLNEVELSTEARLAEERDQKLAAARGYYDKARKAYDGAFERLNAKLASYPKFIPQDDKRWAERERVGASVMLAELHRSMVDYYEAQSYPMGSKERNELLSKAGPTFEDVYRRHRTQMAGFNARMWQGKCFEEQGKLGEAAGIYKELMDHTDEALRPLQKQVAYFQIIIEGKRKDYALAADMCVNWLRNFPRDRRTYEALGVQFELAKDVIAQLPGLEGSERDKAIRVITDNLTEVVRYVSPFKPEALELLQKYRPNAALLAADISKLNFDDALAQAGQAISTLAYENAIALLKVAIRKADALRDVSKVNKARYMLAYAELMSKRYYESAVIAEHVARNYPRDEWAAKSADMATQALIEAYNASSVGNRPVDLERFVDLAKYTAETWPETEQGDSGKMTLGLVELGRGRYLDAVAAFDSVRQSSTRWIDAQGSCGDAHWRQALLLREKGDTPGFEAETKLALDKLNAAIKARKEANASETDLGLINNTSDIANIALETGKPAEALKLLEPVAKKIAALNNLSVNLKAAYQRVMTNILRAHVASDKVDLAIADMKVIEANGGAGNNAAELYYRLGKLLEGEIESIKKRKDPAALKRIEDSYQKFLKALVATKSGQTFQTLRWAGDRLLDLGAAKEANDVYNTLLNTYAKDPEFLKTKDAEKQIFFVRLKQASSLRMAGSLDEAQTMLNELIELNKKSLEAQMELGHLHSARAGAKKGKWLEAYNFWKGLALKLERSSPKPVQYYEAWYEAALALKKNGDTQLAKTTLASVMRLSRNLGTPEMAVKYQELMKSLGK